MEVKSIWISGTTGSGKTTRLVEQFQAWQAALAGESVVTKAPPLLVFAAGGDRRRDLADRLATATQGKYALEVTTPLGFFQREVRLFWPLLVRELSLSAQFPTRLRPETEQARATRLWREGLDAGILYQEGVNEQRLVRRMLDLYQLAAASGTPVEAVPTVLEAGFGSKDRTLWQAMGEALLAWRDWCLLRGFVTYGIVYELYGRHLLPHPKYRQQLVKRYQGVLADDTDEYPGIARTLFEVCLQLGIPGTFTFNPDGAVRLGLSGDPDYMQGLSQQCQRDILTRQERPCLGQIVTDRVLELVEDPGAIALLPPQIQRIETRSRSELLRQTADAIIAAVRSGSVQPQDIAVIAPGLDAIARYTLTEILTKQGIAVKPLNEQRPLVSAPLVRALLVLLTLVYPGLGKLVAKEAIAEMLVVLTRAPNGEFAIDPVRAGLLADYCFQPHPDIPQLLPARSFSRWDRLGHRAAAAYDRTVAWIELQRQQLAQKWILNPVILLDRAIRDLLWHGNHLPGDGLTVLRELLETAQHYWEVMERTWEEDRRDAQPPDSSPIGEFVQLLQRGTVTANPYPLRPEVLGDRAVTLATIFQYRANRCYHPWHFWLDVGSPLWYSGGAAVLFGAPLFLQHRLTDPTLWMPADEVTADEQRLQRILRDLLGRGRDRLILCHSDLATNGQEQVGPLSVLIHASAPWDASSSSETLVRESL